MYKRYGRGEQEDYDLIDYMVRNPVPFENTQFLEDLQNPENLQNLEKYVKKQDEEYIPQKTVKKIKEKYQKKLEKLEAKQEKAKTRKAEKKAAADIKKAEKKALAEIRKAEKKELNKQYYCGLESKKPKKKSMGSYDVCQKLGKISHYGEMTEAQYRQRILDDFKKVIEKHENINRDTQKEILSEREYIENMKMPKKNILELLGDEKKYLIDNKPKEIKIKPTKQIKLIETKRKRKNLTLTQKQENLKALMGLKFNDNSKILLDFYNGDFSSDVLPAYFGNYYGDKKFYDGELYEFFKKYKLPYNAVVKKNQTISKYFGLTLKQINDVMFDLLYNEFEYPVNNHYDEQEKEYKECNEPEYKPKPIKENKPKKITKKQEIKETDVKGKKYTSIDDMYSRIDEINELINEGKLYDEEAASLLRERSKLEDYIENIN